MQTQLRTAAVKFGDYRFELSENIKGNPVARLQKLITVGKNKGQYKLIEGFYFPTEERRQKWIAEKMQNIQKRLKEKQDRKTAEKEALSGHPFKVGDVLYRSWGYEQTNINFYQITEVKEKSVKVRPIGQNIVPGSEGFMSEHVTPAIDQFTGEEEVRKVKVYVGSNAPSYYVGNMSLYTHGERGVYQSHYA